jgi:transcriptional regulator with XRE-family HTH domain
MTEDEIALTRKIRERLHYARQVAGLTLGQISERRGGALSNSRISNYEQGTRRRSIEVARGLARALGSVSPAYLLCIDDPMNLTANGIELLKTYRAADVQGRARVRKEAETEAKRTGKAG